MTITADFLWTIHRACLGGKSSATGAPLPETLAGAPPGARSAHYAMALAAARVTDPGACVEPPADITPEEDERVRRLVDEMVPKPKSVLEISLMFEDGTEETVDLSSVPYEEQPDAIAAATRERRVISSCGRAYTKTADASA
jgi:hypothetical protein